MIDARGTVRDGRGVVVLYVGDLEIDLTIERAEGLALDLNAAWNQAAVEEDDCRTSIAESIHDLEIVGALRTVLAATRPGEPPKPIEGVDATGALPSLASLGLVVWTGNHWKVLIPHEMAADLLERTGRYH